MILMHLSESLIDKILVDKIKEGGPQMQKQLEDTLQVVTKMNKVVQEDVEHENPSQTGNVYTTH